MTLDSGAAGPLASGHATRDWDASTYDRISAPQQSWAHEQLQRLELRGDEVVLDAGCGSGKITAQLAEMVPRGKVYAVDVAPSMAAYARTALGERAVVLCQDLTELSLPEPLDVVFSNAVFHWVPDHPKLFSSLAGVLKPGGRLLAQCGGFGNIDRFRRQADEVAHSGRFAPYFEGWRGPWNYAPAELTAQRLRGAGFTDVETWLVPKPTPLERPAQFVQSVCLVRHLDMLPRGLHEAFVEEVLAHTGLPLTLEYVRLNMSARRAGAAHE